MSKKASGKSAKGSMKKKAARKADKKARKQGLIALPPPEPLDLPVTADHSPAHQHLAQARARWEHGDWTSLLALDPARIAEDPDRARLALILAAAHSHAGDMARARDLARQAMLWGASRSIAARVLLSAAQNSLARAAAALEEDPMPHFEAAIRLVQPHADVPLVARSRRVRELARMGLLPEAATALEAELGLVRADGGSAPEVAILESQIRLLKHELAQTLAKGQLFARPATHGEGFSVERLTAQSVSQLGQDLWVLEKSAYKRGGYFVEFGATDGILLSNSYLLETQFGWNGLCAEPNPGYFAELKKNRRCIVSDACIGARTGQEVEFVLADEFGTMIQYAATDSHAARRDAFRKAGRTLRVQTRSLADFLSEHGAPREIDYLSIDTEGSEFDILQAFPFGRWRIRLISVEHNFTPMRQRILDLLTAQGYVRTEAQWDDWYELKD